METYPESSNDSSPSGIRMFFRLLGQKYQSMLDKSVPYLIPRWIGALIYICSFFLRILVVRGWYIITYGLAIYLLNILLAFLTPKIDPAFEDDDDGMSLPTQQKEEFRPFIRRLPEFKAWHSTMVATTVAFTCTFFQALNIPVFAPVLIMYFFLLFFLTMKRQIKHMIRYRYLPFSWGKPKYQSPADQTIPGQVEQL